MNLNKDIPLRPGRFVENKLITSILSDEFSPGSTLPGERKLAEELGVTRSTIRETLHRMEKEGWITIQHGKPTKVNDFWKEGGLGMLGTLSKYSDILSNAFIEDLLKVRLQIIPECAIQAARYAPEKLAAHLEKSDELGDDSFKYAVFDWKLQKIMVRNCRNRIYPLILNDFTEIYERLATAYFSLEIARKASGKYYKDLLHSIKTKKNDVGAIVGNIMTKSIEIWQETRLMLKG